MEPLGLFQRLPRRASDNLMDATEQRETFLQPRAEDYAGKESQASWMGAIESTAE